MELLLRVYRSTREEELVMVLDWTEETKAAVVSSSSRPSTPGISSTIWSPV